MNKNSVVQEFLSDTHENVPNENLSYFFKSNVDYYTIMKVVVDKVLYFCHNGSIIYLMNFHLVSNIYFEIHFKCKAQYEQFFLISTTIVIISDL